MIRNILRQRFYGDRMSAASAQGENSSYGCHNQSYITVNVLLQIRHLPNFFFSDGK